MSARPPRHSTPGRTRTRMCRSRNPVPHSIRPPGCRGTARDRTGVYGVAARRLASWLRYRDADRGPENRTRADGWFWRPARFPRASPSRMCESPRSGLNRWPPPYQGGALPAELRGQTPQAGIDSKVNDSSSLESFGWRDGVRGVNPHERSQSPPSCRLNDARWGGEGSNLHIRIFNPAP